MKEELLLLCSAMVNISRNEKITKTELMALILLATKEIQVIIEREESEQDHANSLKDQL